MTSIPKDPILCKICLEIPKHPMECRKCCQLYCSGCIYLWFEKSQNFNCPLRCEFGSIHRVKGTLLRIIKSYYVEEAHMEENQGEDMEIVPEKNYQWEQLIAKSNSLTTKGCEKIFLGLEIIARRDKDDVL